MNPEVTVTICGGSFIHLTQSGLSLHVGKNSCLCAAYQASTALCIRFCAGSHAHPNPSSHANTNTSTVLLLTCPPPYLQAPRPGRGLLFRVLLAWPSLLVSLPASHQGHRASRLRRLVRVARWPVAWRLATLPKSLLAHPQPTRTH